MQRVCIVGCSGGGKSTLARELSRRTGLPLIHLDQHYWCEGWQAPALDEVWRAAHRRLVAGERWIIDGSYLTTLAERVEACDTIIHIDLPRWLCLMRVFRRVLAGYGQARPDMAAGCPERFDGEFLRYVWNFKHEHRPRILRTLRQWSGHRRIITLRTPRQVDAWLTMLGRPAPAASEPWHVTGERVEA